MNSLGNVALKTEKNSIDGYIKKYEIFRNTDTIIYKTNDPGQKAYGDINNFVEEE